MQKEAILKELVKSTNERIKLKHYIYTSIFLYTYMYIIHTHIHTLSMDKYSIGRASCLTDSMLLVNLQH